MVAQNADVSALLAKLSKAKPLPKATSAFVTPQQQLQSQIRDSVIENVRRAPTLQESLNAIARGQQSSSNPALGVAAKVFGNPVVKTALAPIIAFDTGRRGIISAAREVTDMLDNDPNTKASFSDFAKQTKDTTFGYGTAFPMEGWGGRLVGFIGDVALDPLTYATFGSAVPAKAVLRGATSTGLRVSTREALGAVPRSGLAAKVLGSYKPVRIFSPEARFNLAKLTGEQARRINLLDDAEAAALGLTKRTESQIQVIEQLVAKYGKTRVPQDIARDIGLPKAGIYWFGSRVKMPLSGLIGGGLERVLAGTRTRITGRTTGAVARWVESITPEGVASDTAGIKTMRRALITGKATPEEASTYLKLLDDNRQRRVLENITKQEYDRQFNIGIANDPLILANRETLYEFIENPGKLATATTTQRQAVDKVAEWSAALANQVEQAMRLVDPAFEMSRVPNYFPHQMTQKALNYMDDLRNPFVQQLRAYFHTDVTDPAAAFKQRTLQPDSPFFGTVLTEADIQQGVKRLNQIARTQGNLDFDFFETDVIKAFAKYGESYAREISRAGFLRRMFDSGVLKMLQDKGIYDDEALKALELAVRQSTKDVLSKTGDMKNLAKNLASVISEQIDNRAEQQARVVRKAAEAAKGARAATKASYRTLGETKRAIDTIVEGLENLGLADAAQRLESYGISGVLPEMVVDAPLKNILGRLEKVTAGLRVFNEMLVSGQKTMDDFAAELPALKQQADFLEAEAQKYVEKLSEFDNIHAVLGDFVNGKYAELVMESAEEGGGEVFEGVVGLLKNQTLRDKVGLTNKGRIKGPSLRRLWGSTAAEADPRVKVMQNWIDPTGAVTQNKLQRLTIERVREIISNSTVTASSVTDLRDALTWLVVRDFARNDTLLDSLVASLAKKTDDIAVSEGNSLAALVNDNGTISRITKIKKTIDDLTKKQQIINNIARKAPNEKQYSLDELQNIQNQINGLTDEINLLSADFAVMSSSSPAVALRGWKQVSVNRPNEIVADANIIERLFNDIRSTNRTAFVVEKYTDAYTPLGTAEEIVSVDLGEALINALKARGIENQKLTYKHVENALEEYTNQLMDTEPGILTRFEQQSDIADAIKTRDALQEKLKNATAAVNQQDRLALSAELDPRSYAESIMDYSNQALEYYLYSEVKNQFNSLMDELAPFGVAPSYGIYQRLLGDISKQHIVKVQRFQTKITEAENVLRKIQEAVQSQPSSLQPIVLREKLLEVLDGELGATLDAIFPEVRMMVQKQRISDLSRLQANDDVLLSSRSDIVTLIRQYDQASGQGKAPQRAGYLRGTGTAGKEAQAVPTTKQAMQQGAGVVPAPAKPQINVEELISRLQGSTANINIKTLIKQVRSAMRYRMTENQFLEFTQKLDVIDQTVSARVDILKLQQAEAKAARKAAGLPAGTRAASKQAKVVRGSAKENYNIGLAGSLDNALNGTSQKGVQDFFGNLFGGLVRDPSKNDIFVGSYLGQTGAGVKRLRKGPVRETERTAKRALTKFKEIKRENSLIGTMERKLSERMAALRATTDLDYPIDVTVSAGSVLPTLTNKDVALRSVYGVRAYAELLQSRAREIEATILDNDAFVARIRELDKQLDKNSSVPLEVQRLAAIKDAEVAIKGTTAFRISPQTNLDGLPAGLRKKIIETRKLKIQAAQIMESDEYLAANHEQTLMYVLNELADIDAWRIVDTNGNSGLYFNESGLNPVRTWNAPRYGQTVASNEDSLALLRRANDMDRTKQPTVHAIKEEPFYLNKMDLDDSNVIYLLDRGNEPAIRITRANVKRLNDEYDLVSSPIRQLRLVRSDEFKNKALPGEKVYLDFESQILGGKSYDPNSTWVRMEAEGRVVGATKTAYEGVVTKEALEEVWVPVTSVIDTRGTSIPILERNFTADEWESLFIPGPIVEKGRLQTLNSQKNKFDQQRIRFADLSRAPGITKQQREALLTKYDRAQRGYDEAVRELALYKARTSARVKLNRLVEAFSDTRVAEALGVTGKRGKEPSPADVAKAYVQRQLQGLDDKKKSILVDQAENRRAALKDEWKKSEHFKVLSELRKVQKQMNDTVLKDYANNLSSQYQNYVDLLDELTEATSNWTKAAATVENAKLIAKVLDEPKVRAVVPEQQALPDAQISDTLETEIQRLLNAGDAKSREEALVLIENHNQNLKQSADVVRGIANQLDTAQPQAPLTVLPEAPEIRAGLQQVITDKPLEAEVIRKQITDLEFAKTLKEQSIGDIEKIIKDMTASERELLAAKAQRMKELAQIDAKRLNLINSALQKAKVGKKGKNAVDRLIDLEVTHNLQVASYNQARHLETMAEDALQSARDRLELLGVIRDRGKKFQSKANSKELEWVPDFNDWYNEAVDLMRLVDGADIPQKTKNVIIAYIDGVNALQLSKASLSVAEASLAAEKGIKQMFDETGIGANMLIKELEKGYEYLNKDVLPNVMVKQAYAEILRNANSFRDPLTGATLTKVLKRWNSYWKPIATTTPGFHVRNNIGNLMALVFGGAKISNLPEAFSVSLKWMDSVRQNVSWDDFVRTLTPAQQESANTARWAVAATGGGVYSDVQLADNVVQNFGPVKASRKFGFDSDSFARFMFSYDAAMQGFSPEQAAMRTKRFYIDYEDVSSFDKTMRQIVPFWMWTSRNVVTQVQNMWTNPKPYLVYNSFVRNFRDKDDDNAVSKSWRDLQAFKLPFGKDLYAMPDLGFTRVQQQLAMAQDPTRFLADVSPLIRVPGEFIAGKQFYNNREFKDTPVQVEGFGLGSVLQPLAQMVGRGQTNQQGQRFIDDKLLYALTALIPPASIAERMMPSTGADAGGFNANALAGFLGSPVKQFTPQMEKNELLRRLFEIQDTAAKTKLEGRP